MKTLRTKNGGTYNDIRHRKEKEYMIQKNKTTKKIQNNQLHLCMRASGVKQSLKRIST